MGLNFEGIQRVEQDPLQLQLQPQLNFSGIQPQQPEENSILDIPILDRLFFGAPDPQNPNPPTLRTLLKTVEPIIAVLDFFPEIIRKRLERTIPIAKKLFSNPSSINKEDVIETFLNPKVFGDIVNTVKKVSVQGSVLGDITAPGNVPSKEQRFGFLPNILEEAGMPEFGKIPEDIPVVGGITTRGFIGFIGELSIPSLPGAAIISKSSKINKARKVFEFGLEGTEAEIKASTKLAKEIDDAIIKEAKINKGQIQSFQGDLLKPFEKDIPKGKTTGSTEEFFNIGGKKLNKEEAELFFKTLSRKILREEAIGERVDELIDSNVSGIEITEKFWNKTFNNLPERAKKIFTRLAEDETGLDLTIPREFSEFMDDIVKGMPKNAEELQFTHKSEQGFIALMDEANKIVKETSGKSSKQVVNKLLNPKVAIKKDLSFQERLNLALGVRANELDLSEVRQVGKVKQTSNNIISTDDAISLVKGESTIEEVINKSVQNNIQSAMDINASKLVDEFSNVGKIVDGNDIIKPVEPELTVKEKFERVRKEFLAVPENQITVKVIKLAQDKIGNKNLQELFLEYEPGILNRSTIDQGIGLEFFARDIISGKLTLQDISDRISAKKRLEKLAEKPKKVFSAGIDVNESSAGEIIDSFTKQKNISRLIKEKNINSQDFNDALKEGIGLNDLRLVGDSFSGKGQVTSSQLDEIITRLKKLDDTMPDETKRHILTHGVEPPNNPPTGAMHLVEEYGEPGIRRSMRGFQVNLLQTLETTFRKMGEIGDQIADRFLNAYQESAMNSARDIKLIEDLFNPLSTAETKALVLSFENPTTINSLSDKVLATRFKFNKLTTRYADLSEGLNIKTIIANGKKVDFQRKSEYFPHVFDFNWAKGINGRRRIIRRIMKRDSLTEQQAKAKLDEIRKFTRKHRAEPNLEYERIFDAPEWLGDPFSPGFSKSKVKLALERYIAGSNRRFSEQKYVFDGGKKVFGEDFDTVKQLIARESLDDNRKILDMGINRLLGLDRASMEAPSLRAMRNYQVIRRLGFAWIPNFFQTMVTVVPKATTLGFRNAITTLFGGYSDAFKRSGRQFAEDVGAISEQTIRDVIGLSGAGISGKAATVFMKYITPFAKFENMNNIFAANVGKRYFVRAAELLADEKGLAFTMFKNAKRANATTDLKKLGLDQNTISRIKKEGSSILTDDDISRASWRFARLTQFRATPLDLPLFASSDWGRLLFQFKTFGINISKLGWNDFFKPAFEFVKSGGRRGAVAPLATFLGSGWVAGEVVGDIRAWINGRERPELNEEFWRRTSENLFWAGTFGMFSDIVTSINQGRALELILGPTAGSIVEGQDVVRKIPDAFDNEEMIELLSKAAVKQLPFIGQVNPEALEELR